MKTDFKNIHDGADTIGVLTITDESKEGLNTLLYIIYADDGLRILSTWKYKDLISSNDKLDDLADMFVSDKGLTDFEEIPGFTQVDYEDAELIIERAREIIIEGVEGESSLFSEKGEIRK